MTEFMNDIDEDDEDEEELSIWKKDFASLEDYYKSEYNFDYYYFDRYQLEIDPDETPEDIEAYDYERQIQENRKCMISFPYFCQKYVRIAHPKKALIPFIIYNYQKKVVDTYERHRWTILSKFRQGGLTTVTVIWSLWRCLFKLDETIMVVSKSDREAIASGEIVKRALDELPSWLRPDMDKNNDHQKIFVGTGCKLFFYTPEAARGRSISYLIIDEAAFIPAMDKHWKALYPTISTGGSCIVVSTVNGVGNWYHTQYTQAEKKKNEFSIIDLDYQEHPDYNNDKWVKQTRANLGEKGWKQEVLRDFLGSGDTFIDPELIQELMVKVEKTDISRILFPDYQNAEEANDIRFEELDQWERGALWIWNSPIEGRDYTLGVDTAEGVGEEGDNSCFQIIDSATCEQVAEFYSNKISPNIFANVVLQVATMYNNALVVVENIGSGIAVLSKLRDELFYEHLFHDTVQPLPNHQRNIKVGIKTTKINRPMFLDALQSRIIHRSIEVKSRRLVRELQTFIYNKNTKRAEAEPGAHDDAIMAMAFALYARDKTFRQIPAGMEVPQQLTEGYRLDIYTEIRSELNKINSERWLKKKSFDEMFEKKEDEPEDKYFIPSPSFKPKRNFDSFLREFGF